VGRKAKPDDEKRITVTMRMLPRWAAKLDLMAEVRDASRGIVVEKYVSRSKVKKEKREDKTELRNGE